MGGWGAGPPHRHSPTAAVSPQVPDKSFPIARGTGRVYRRWSSCQAQEMPSLKAERRIRPGSREGLAAAPGWLPAGPRAPRCRGLGLGLGRRRRRGPSRVAGPVRPCPGRSPRPRPAAAAAAAASRPGPSPTPPRGLPPAAAAAAPPGTRCSCAALPVLPAASQLPSGGTWHTPLAPPWVPVPGAPPQRARRGEFRPGRGVPGTGPAPALPRPCPALRWLANPGAAAPAPPVEPDGGSLGMLGAPGGEEGSPGGAPAEPSPHLLGCRHLPEGLGAPPAPLQSAVGNLGVQSLQKALFSALCAV
ncbi:unnamed protein product [Nyctereutes procyonoides]|uniref:(raccoon dog) hypothetical protein n=1 Tax=Nyctereutes procyonoides TaxID=34880 RepID=A0A811ZFB1_NYCPR|nr:unnamed protein product [Nyctereutes procyonoides]